jgi:CheY-like chemotaxis protein
MRGLLWVLSLAVMMVLIPVAFAFAWFSVVLAPIALIVGLPFLGVPYLMKPTFREQMRQKVLVVDDDEISILPLRALLENKGVQVDYAPDGQSMKQKLSASPYNLIILDSLMPNLSGEKALAEVDKIVKKIAEPVPVIFYTSNKELVIPKDLKHFLVLDRWSKVDPSLLETRMNKALNKALVYVY